MNASCGVGVDSPESCLKKPAWPLRSIAVGAVVYVGLTLRVYAFADALPRLLLLPIGWIVGHLYPEFDIVRLDVVWMHGELVCRVDLHPVHSFFVGPTLVAGPFDQLATLTATTSGKPWVQTVLVAGTLVFAWPGPSPRRKALAVGIVTIILVPLVLLDVPFVLAGAMDDLLRASFAPATVGGSWLAGWMKAMDGGGRLASGVMAAYVSVLLAGRIARDYRLKPTAA
jgi:hypothetical protein